ncbi:nucleotide exchange factor GrpE [Buchnera aphidicola (Kurisakia onigurumii)]|uniref:nucleotide exchange factor GrpE n=1 Tax=Buchnera aphidicola TaxID=9 RepID=UPI0031B6BD57
MKYEKKNNELHETKKNSKFYKIEKKIKILKKNIVELKKIEEKKIEKLFFRSEKDIQNAHKFSLETEISNFLPIIDSLERAIDTVKNMDSLIQEIPISLKLILNLLLNLLKEFHIRVIFDEKKLFNPDIHQAVVMIPSETIEKNNIISVMQKGYILHNRLLRAALVTVSSGKNKN